MYAYIATQQRNNMWRNILSCLLTDTEIILIQNNYSVGIVICMQLISKQLLSCLLRSGMMYVYIVIQQRNNMWRNIPICPINRHRDNNSKELFSWYCQLHVTDFKTIAEHTWSGMMYVYIVIQQRNNMWRNIPICPINRHNDINSKELFSWYCQPHVTDFKTIAELLVQTWCMYT